MSVVLTSSLLHKRDFDYDEFTQNIIKIIGHSVEAATKLFIKKNRTVTIRQIELKPEILPGYAFMQLGVKPNLGDIVLINNMELLIDEDNIDNIVQMVNAVISLKALDSNSSLIMYKNLCDVKVILETSKDDSVSKLLKLDLIELKETPELINKVHAEILDNPEFINILEVLTSPPELDIMGFDKSRLTTDQINQLKIQKLIPQSTLLS